MERRVIRGPPSELSTLPDDRSGLRWERDLQGRNVEYEEELDDEYTYSDDSFEEYNSDDDEAEKDDGDKAVLTNFKKINLGHGINLLVPEDSPDIRCNAESLSAERRMEELKCFSHHHDEIMVSDVYQLQGDKLSTLKCKPMSIQMTVVLPTTRLNHKDLFRFHVMGKRDETWTEIWAEYDNSLLTFPVRDVQSFVAYARPIPEFKNVTPSGFTFVSGKDSDIRVEIPEGSVDTDITMTVKLHPVDTRRIDWYRMYDPTAFEGIYAFTDILSVRHNMETVLTKDTSVQLPINDSVKEEYEIKCFNIEHGNYNVRHINRDSSKKGKVTMSYTVKNSTSCQASCVRPGIDESMLTAAAKFQAGLLDMCKVLMYLSKTKDDRFLTIEVVESPNAEEVELRRHDRGFYEIINSRSKSLEISQNKRLRIDLAGNIQSAELQKKTKYTFVYSVKSRNNSIQFKIQKNPMGGMQYSIVTVLIGGYRAHEVHFDYPEKGRNLKEIKNLFQTKSFQEPVASGSMPLPSKHQKDIVNRETKVSDRAMATTVEEVSRDQLKPKVSPQPSEDTGYNTDITETRRRSTPTASVSRGSNTPLEHSESEHGLSISPLPKGKSPQQRPLTAVTVASSVPEVHPLLRQRSLQILAEKLPLEICQRVLIDLDMSFDKISKVKKEAKDEDVNDVFLLLLRWYQSVKGTKLDPDLIQDFLKSLRDKGRSDLSEALRRVLQKGRELKEEDFPK